jgi:hypothetical protein
VEKTENKVTRGRWKLFAILAVCAAPMIGSYITYYGFKPEARSNYGTILDPRNFPVPVLNGVGSDGKSVELAALKGKWLMLQIDSAGCTETCQKKLYDMRQLRTAQGKEMERIGRVWLVTDKTEIDPKLNVGIAGTHVIKVDPVALQKWLPTEPTTSMQEHIYLIDPMGNLMMRFPKDADTNKVKKDLAKLLKASAIG